MSNVSTVFDSSPSIANAWSVRRLALDGIKRQALERRERSIHVAASQTIPTTRQEEWKYSSLRSLVHENFDLIGTPDVSNRQGDSLLSKTISHYLVPRAIPIVFVDGQLDLSWPGAETLDDSFIKKLAEVERVEDDSWWNEWQNAPGMEALFSALTAGMAHDGIVIQLDKNTYVERPVHILHIATSRFANKSKMNRILVKLERGARLRVYEQFINMAEESAHASIATWSSCLTQIKLGPTADCGYYRMIDAAGAYHTGSVTAELDHGSRLETFSLAAGSKFARINMDVRYLSKDAECILNGLYLAQGHEHVDHHTLVVHAVGNCRTHQFYKGIVKDQSRAVFNGKIFIQRDAQATEAYQTCKNLLLSSEAEVDAKPQLEIDADDVKASHGVAIGTIQPSELFYLQSRCIGREEAMAMLCRGFADDVVNRVHDIQAREYLANMVGNWFLANFDSSHGGGK